MSDLSDVQVKAKKVAQSLRANKDLSPTEKKSLQDWMDKIVDKLDDLTPRKDQLEELVSGLKTLEQEVKKFNSDQNPLKDNAFGLAQSLKKINSTPKTKAILSDLGAVSDTIQKTKDVKTK